MFYNDSVPGHHIATHFCTVHDNCAVMIWAKCCIDCCIIRITAECFHWSYRHFRSNAPYPVLAAFLRTSWLSIFRELLSLACFLFFFFGTWWKWHFSLLYPSHNEVVGGVYWFHYFCPSVHRSVRPSVRPASHVHSSPYSSGWIHFMFIHHIKQCVSRIKFLAKFQILIFLAVFLICNFDFVLFWLGIWCESLVWVIVGRWGVSQNAGVLVDTRTFPTRY